MNQDLQPNVHSEHSETKRANDHRVHAAADSNAINVDLELTALGAWLRANGKFLAVYLFLVVNILLGSARFADHFNRSYQNESLNLGTLFSLSGIVGLIASCCYLALAVSVHFRKEYYNEESQALNKWLPWYFLEPIIGWLAGYAACALILFFMSTVAGDALTLSSSVTFPKFLIIMACASFAGLKGTSLLKMFDEFRANKPEFKGTQPLRELLKRPINTTESKDRPQITPVPQATSLGLDEASLRELVLKILNDELPRKEEDEQKLKSA